MAVLLLAKPIHTPVVLGLSFRALLCHVVLEHHKDLPLGYAELVCKLAQIRLIDLYAVLLKAWQYGDRISQTLQLPFLEVCRDT